MQLGVRPVPARMPYFSRLLCDVGATDVKRWSWWWWCIPVHYICERKTNSLTDLENVPFVDSFSNPWNKSIGFFKRLWLLIALVVYLKCLLRRNHSQLKSYRWKWRTWKAWWKISTQSRNTNLSARFARRQQNKIKNWILHLLGCTWNAEHRST